MKTTTSKTQLGTFSGVFAPSILTILGIILFLRLGHVVGSAGLGRSLLIIALANSISIITSISLSAVATNLKVREGGDYYLISRTLGMEFGGSIGLVLFLAQSISIAFYAIGFAEAATSIFPYLQTIPTQLIAAAAVSFLFPLAWKGADWATRFQYIVMVLLGLSLLSFFIGGIQKWDTGLLQSNWSPPANGSSFWVLFAIFFPAVTGFTQGVSMSGDLKNSGKSIPLGTFLAVGISIIIYFAVAIVFAASLPNGTLAIQYDAMKTVAYNSYIIDAGVIAATLSSAMASFMGAPRILQSLASDKIFPFLTLFAKVNKTNNNPQRGVLLAACIALLTILLGQLNIIAGVVSMFFLISYGLLNYATYFEARSNSPSFRPRFKWFSPRLSFIGSLTCLAAILAIDLYSGMFATAVLFSIYQYLKRTAGPSRWADSTRSYHLQQVRTHLLAAKVDPEHARDWRPQLLVVIGDTTQEHTSLLRFATWIEGGSGFIEAVQIFEGDGIESRKINTSTTDTINSIIIDNELPIFPLALKVSDYEEAIGVILQSSGIGPLRPNIVVYKWLEEPENFFAGIDAYLYVKHLRLVFKYNKNLVLYYSNPAFPFEADTVLLETERIDVWWQGNATSKLMLLLAHLMTRTLVWNKVKIRVLTKGDGKKVEEEKIVIKKILDDIRIEAEPYIVSDLNAATIIENSSDAAFVFLPMKIENNQILAPNGESLQRSLPRLKACAIVMAAENIDLDAAPEQGIAGELAQARDKLKVLEKKSRKADRILSDKELHIENLKEKLSQIQEDKSSSNLSVDDKNLLQKEMETAIKDADRAYRRAKSYKTHVEKAAQTIVNMTKNL